MDRFVVGTGRCGSTLLTTMLAKHPDVLVLSEFFVTLDRKSVFSRVPISGREFAELIDREHFVVPPLRRRMIESSENLGDVPEAERVPALMVSTIPMNSDRPLELYAELLDAVRRFPTQSPPEHYTDLFAWLLDTTGKTLWIERSGPSAEYMPELVELYPRAKYVHLHRDGPEAAMSMAHNPYFQLVASFYYDPPTREELLGTEYGMDTITGTDTLSRRLRPDYLAPERFGAYWSYELTMLYKALAKLDADQVLDVRYEDLIARPREVLERVSAFHELPSRPDWIDEAAALISRSPSTHLSELEQDDLEALRRSCETGALLTGRKQTEWVIPTLEMLEELSYARFGENA